MKRFVLYIIIGIGLTACSNVEFSNNGDLDGFWLLSSVDSIQIGKNYDCRTLGLTWAFQGKILEVRDVKRVHQDIIMSFNHTDNQLKTFSPYLVYREEGDWPIDDTDYLKPYGINRLEESFRVLELTSSEMTLESDILRLHFRKY